MKEYLIRIEFDTGSALFTTISGDTPTRPFTIANNLWNYQYPGHAAQRLEMLARSREAVGYQVKRIYGKVPDMPYTGNRNNVAATICDFL